MSGTLVRNAEKLLIQRLVEIIFETEREEIDIMPILPTSVLFLATLAGNDHVGWGFEK